LFLTSFSSYPTAPIQPYPLSLHDALPICPPLPRVHPQEPAALCKAPVCPDPGGDRISRRLLDRHPRRDDSARRRAGLRHCPLLRSEEHTSELQSRENLVCRLLLEKKKNL